jgi:hypothetical protein
MKKQVFWCLFVLTSYLSYAQGEDYGLSKEDLNLLMGQFMEPRGSYDRSIWGDMTFSWGKQRGVNDNGLHIVIDHDKRIALRLGPKYEQYLTINETGTPFVIRRIEKINEGQFLLYLIYVSDPPKEAGVIKITFFDSQHLLIDNSLLVASALGFRGILWKVAGPGQRKRTIFPDLPDAEL